MAVLPYTGQPISTELYGVDVVGSHYAHRLFIKRGPGNLKGFIFTDDGNAYAYAYAYAYAFAFAAPGHWAINA